MSWNPMSWSRNLWFLGLGHHGGVQDLPDGLQRDLALLDLPLVQQRVRHGGHEPGGHDHDGHERRQVQRSIQGKCQPEGQNPGEDGVGDHQQGSHGWALEFEQAMNPRLSASRVLWMGDHCMPARPRALSTGWSWAYSISLPALAELSTGSWACPA